MPRVSQGRVEKATRAELRRLGAKVESDSLAASAVSLAQHLDSLERSFDAPKAATAAAAAAHGHRMLMADIARSAVRPERDAVDEVNAQRAKRRAAADG